MNKENLTVFFQVKIPTMNLISPLTLASMRPYLQYPLLLSVCVSVTPMVNHSVLISHTFSLIPVFIVVKPSHCLHVYWVMTLALQFQVWSIYSDFLSKRDKLQNLMVIDSKKCHWRSVCRTLTEGLKVFLSRLMSRTDNSADSWGLTLASTRKNKIKSRLPHGFWDLKAWGTSLA